MLARAEILGDSGENHPNNWVGGLASPDLHAIAILFARDEDERESLPDRAPQARCALRRRGGALHPGPPSDRRHLTMHTTISAIRDRLSEPVIEGLRMCRRPVLVRHSSRANSSSGTRTKTDRRPICRNQKFLSRNGSYMAYRRLQEHVGKFRDFLREHGDTHEEQEFIAAKLMGRWRSGAPLTLAPEKDDPVLGADLLRNNNFNYKEMDPHGYAVPLGSHIRRMNPRDTAANMNRRRMIRRGATYGPPLPEGASRRRRRTRHWCLRDLCELDTTV